MLTIGIIILILYNSTTINYKNNKELKELIKLTSIITIYSLIIIYNSNIIKIINWNITLFNGQFQTTYYTIIIISLLLILLLIYLTLINYYTDYYKENYKIKEITILLLFNILSLSLFINSYTTLSLFITVELQSYTLYLITGIYHREKYNESDPKGSLTVKVGLLYFLIGTFASIIFLIGITLIYQYTGLISLYDISTYIITLTSINNIEKSPLLTNELILGLTITLIGLLIKIGSGPLHSWLINIYIKSPTIITSWISIVGKISLLTVIYTILWTLGDGQLTSTSPIIKTIIIIMTISLIVGSLGGLIQTNVKSIIAYSGILNTGYLLMTIIPSTPHALSAYLFFILQYSITHITWFILLILTLTQYKRIIPKTPIIHNNNKIINNLNIREIYEMTISPKTNITYLTDLYQLIIKNRLLTLGYIITLTSFIGLPPLAGFYGKLHILESTLATSNIINGILLIFVSGISTIYYGYIIQTIIWNNNSNIIINNNNIKKINDNKNNNLYIYILLIILLIILIYPLPLYEIAIKGIEITEQINWI